MNRTEAKILRSVAREIRNRMIALGYEVTPKTAREIAEHALTKCGPMISDYIQRDTIHRVNRAVQSWRNFV